MVQAIAVLAALAVQSQAAPGMPVMRPSPARVDAALELSAAETDMRALTRDAASLRLAVSSIRRRLDASSAREYLRDLKQWGSSVRRLQRKTMRLSASASNNIGAARLSGTAEDLYAEASGLSTEATWLAFDLRGLGLHKEAGEAERLTRDGAADSRQLVYDAEAISAAQGR